MASFDNVPVSLFLADRTHRSAAHPPLAADPDRSRRAYCRSLRVIIVATLGGELAERFAGLTSQMR